MSSLVLRPSCQPSGSPRQGGVLFQTNPRFLVRSICQLAVVQKPVGAFRSAAIAYRPEVPFSPLSKTCCLSTRTQNHLQSSSLNSSHLQTTSNFPSKRRSLVGNRYCEPFFPDHQDTYPPTLEIVVPSTLDTTRLLLSSISKYDDLDSLLFNLTDNNHLFTTYRYSSNATYNTSWVARHAPDLLIHTKLLPIQTLLFR